MEPTLKAPPTLSGESLEVDPTCVLGASVRSATYAARLAGVDAAAKRYHCVALEQVWVATFGAPAPLATSALAALSGSPGRSLSPRRAGAAAGPARWRQFVEALARALVVRNHPHVAATLGVVPLDRHGVPVEDAPVGAVMRHAPLYIVSERGACRQAVFCVYLS